MIKKILSIDGGGIKGTFPASFLASVEEACQCSITEHFDLIVGTSTGGIIALALGMGMSAQEILSFYEKYGPGIFSGNRASKWLRHWLLSKYSSEGLKDALIETFGNRKLGESKVRLVIPSMNLETGAVHIFKTAHHPKYYFDYLRSVVDIALATSAAPTYFPSHISANGVPLLDGGLWANNPVGLAVVEAIGVLKWDAAALRVLSLGCTSEPLNVGWGKSWALGKSYWSTKLTDVFMTAQSSGSIGTANVLTSEDHSSLFRFDPIVPNGRFALDTAANIELLKGLGHDAARQAFPEIKFFFDQPAETFEPYRKLDSSL